MMRRFPATRFLLLTSAVWLASLAGCALDRLPRIDPSGERILIFPGDNQPATSTPAFAQPNAAAGNLLAPPAYADSSQGPLERLLCGPRIVGPPVGTAPGPTATPRDRVTLTPERLLAPIGSEVVVRAGLCGEEGYLVNNQRIEWALDQQGVGQFLDIGDEGETDVLRWPWQRPNIVDNLRAIGYTTPFYTCLKRNQADPSDDLQIRPGDAWVSVTSATEGTSFITAHAPGIADWATRKASAVIYWIDAQWALPPSVTAPMGQPQTLTTTVTRQSDGAPIEGWIVRYEVVGSGGAQLGYEAGQVAEATTDRQGRASIEVTPTDAGPGSATVGVTIVRPDTPGAAGSPEISVGSGQATITWAAGVPATGLPPISPGVIAPLPGTPAAPPVFQEPLGQGPLTPPGPRVPPAPAGQPNLTVQLRRADNGPITVGDQVEYDIVVTNRGDGAARNIKITSRFDRGLSNEYDARGLNRVEYVDMSDLGPGESDRIKLRFDVLEAGRRELNAAVVADAATEVYDRAAFDALPVRRDPPELRVVMVASRQYTVDQESDVNDIRGVVENTGAIEATNVIVRMRVDPVMTVLGVQRAAPGQTMTATDDGAVWTIANLPPGERRTFTIQVQFDRASPRSQIRLFVDADEGVTKADAAEFEVRPRVGGGQGPGSATPGGLALGGPAPGGPPLGPAGPGTEAPAPGALSITLPSASGPARVGRNSVLTLSLSNNGATPQRQVVVEVLMPPELQADLRGTQAPTAPQQGQDGVIRFAPIAELPPGGREAILIPYTAVNQGRVTIQARVSSQTSPAGQPVSTSLEVLPR
ncbi:MAG: hypothetical protein AAGB00_07545 [Planctomycetota bacterium]